MRQRPDTNPSTRAGGRNAPDGVCRTTARGFAVLNCPMLNKGTAFSPEERLDLGLTGLLPPDVSTLAAQVRHAYVQYERIQDPLGKNAYLTTLHDRNEILFYRLFSEHLREMIPIVNDLTVGLAMQQYHHECRPPRGVYLSIDHPEAIERAFLNLNLGPGDVDLILATDSEQIPGIGDWGVGGIEAAIGKLAICTAAGGIHPARAIPVMLDVGTNRESLLHSPSYIGNRHTRVCGAAYDAFLDAYVAVASRLFPQALLQWEDFSPTNGRHILRRFRHDGCFFNDGMQGTGAITLAALVSAIRACGTPLRQQNIVIFGAGTAGIGIADQICAALTADGLSSHEAARHIWCVDRHGLLVHPSEHAALDFQADYARPARECEGWLREGPHGGISLAEVVRQVAPSVLIGASGETGAFTEAIVREMATHIARPIIFVLSTPGLLAEAAPARLIAWSNGRALIATGSPSAPVTYKGTTFVIAQINNSMLYPGLALGAIVARASRVSDGMLIAAANAVSSLVTVRQPGASLLPHFDDLRAVSATVAVAVAEAAATEGLARLHPDDIVQQVEDAMWQPEYHPILAV